MPVSLTGYSKGVRELRVRSNPMLAFVLALFVFFAGCQTDHSAVSNGSAVVRVIDHTMFDALPADDKIVLDVRTPNEYAEGHVPGALNIPHNELASRIDELSGESGKTIIAYCESGVRTRRALDVLQKAGFTDLGHLKGDMAGWRAANRAIE